MKMEFILFLFTVTLVWTAICSLGYAIGMKYTQSRVTVNNLYVVIEDGEILRKEDRDE